MLHVNASCTHYLKCLLVVVFSILAVIPKPNMNEISNHNSFYVIHVNRTEIYTV